MRRTSLATCLLNQPARDSPSSPSSSLSSGPQCRCGLIAANRSGVALLQKLMIAGLLSSPMSSLRFNPTDDAPNDPERVAATVHPQPKRRIQLRTQPCGSSTSRSKQLATTHLWCRCSSAMQNACIGNGSAVGTSAKTQSQLETAAPVLSCGLTSCLILAPLHRDARSQSQHNRDRYHHPHHHHHHHHHHLSSSSAIIIRHHQPSTSLTTTSSDPQKPMPKLQVPPKPAAC